MPAAAPAVGAEARLAEEEGSLFSADVLVDATGARCGLFTAIGFEQVTALKSQRALGVVCVRPSATPRPPPFCTCLHNTAAKCACPMQRLSAWWAMHPYLLCP